MTQIKRNIIQILSTLTMIHKLWRLEAMGGSLNSTSLAQSFIRPAARKIKPTLPRQQSQKSSTWIRKIHKASFLCVSWLWIWLQLRGRSRNKSRYSQWPSNQTRNSPNQPRISSHSTATTKDQSSLIRSGKTWWSSYSRVEMSRESPLSK